MSWLDILRHEWRAIFSDAAILLTVFGGVLLYSVLYPLPYAQKVVRNQEVVVVNLDNSQLSRRLERMIDATPQVHLSDRAQSLEEAKRIFIDRKLAGILLIPENFYLDLLRGRRPTLSFAGDAGLFLVYGTVVEGMVGAGNTLAAEVKVGSLLKSGRPQAMAAEQYSAVRLNILPVFNGSMGYVNYVIPAVFVLILHQTLLMGAGMRSCLRNVSAPEREEILRTKVSPFRLLVVRCGIFVTLYWLLSMYYFGAAFTFYTIPHLANFLELNLLILPFLLSATLLGICLGASLPRRELTILVVLLSSMPLIFLSGFIWPLSAIPAALVEISRIVPAIPAIQAFLALNQMGAEFSDILPLLKQLWLCALFYGCLAWWLLRRNCATNRLHCPERPV